MRFRTPPGWPTPTAAWVERNRLTEPEPGWVPAPGLPAAPHGWRFWDVDRRALVRGRSSALVWAGLALLALGVVTSVLALLLALGRPLGGLAAIGLVPVVVGAALAVTATVRGATDQDAELVRHVVQGRRERASAELDPADEWGRPDALPFVESREVRTMSPLYRQHRTRIVVVAGAAALATVLGASLAVVPAVDGLRDDGQTLAVGQQHSDAAPEPSAPDTDSADPSPSTSDPASVVVDATLEQGDELQADCSVAQARGGAVHCWAWRLTAPSSCEARVTAHFGPTADGPATRSVTRFVAVTPGIPLTIALTGDETVAGLDHPECVTPADTPYPIATYDTGSALPDGDFPGVCDRLGCDGFVFDVDTACAAATVQMAVDDAAADVHTRDYVVVQAITDSTKPGHNEVFLPYVNGVQPAGASITSVTCED